MSKDTIAGHKSRDTADSIDIEPRTRRAVTECMTVLSADGDTYTVVGQNGGGEYEVNARTGDCSCPDSEYNLSAHERCKHAQRVEIILGEHAMPAVDPDDVDPHLGEHVRATARRAVADGGIVEPGDDAEILDDEEGEEVVDLADMTDEPGEERPDDCQCAPFLADGDLPCWPCYREGFATPAPDVGGDE
jgi:hypothetical protein